VNAATGSTTSEVVNDSYESPEFLRASIKVYKTLKALHDTEGLSWSTDSLAVEEPLEIRLGGRRFTLTMRTPGHDHQLVVGFLLAEGFIDFYGEVDEIRAVRARAGKLEPNALDVILRVPAARLRERLQRNFMTSSSCGVCGKTTIASIRRRVSPLKSATLLSRSELLAMPELMRRAQHVFKITGGLHAAGLFCSMARASVTDVISDGLSAPVERPENGCAKAASK
jgi:formate dehydrogenase accessory protein FdhD